MLSVLLHFPHSQKTPSSATKCAITAAGKSTRKRGNFSVPSSLLRYKFTPYYSNHQIFSRFFTFSPSFYPLSCVFYIYNVWKTTFSPPADMPLHNLCTNEVISSPHPSITPCHCPIPSKQPTSFLPCKCLFSFPLFAKIAMPHSCYIGLGHSTKADCPSPTRVEWSTPIP